MGRGDDDDVSIAPTQDPLKSEEVPNNDPESTKSPSQSTNPKTDSGITHTIPNSSIVTVTKHTVVFSEAPSPSTTSLPESSSLGTASTTDCSGCDEPSQSAASPEDVDLGGGITPGAIAGIATSGAVVLALFAIIWMVSCHRHRHRHRHREREGSGVSDGDEGAGGMSRVDAYEKVTPHTTGTEESADPFAPFGGRADQPHGPYPPQSGTFEMDGSSMAPVELPAISIVEAPDNSASPTNIESPLTPTTCADPRATLASSSHGGLQYVNQWNQYKAIADEANRARDE